jgi:hypothetical protein
MWILAKNYNPKGKLFLLEKEYLEQFILNTQLVLAIWKKQNEGQKL